MATASSESKDASDHVVELIVRDASAPSSDAEADSEDKEQIAPLLFQERPKINIFTASYPRTKPRGFLNLSFMLVMIWSWLSDDLDRGSLCRLLSRFFWMGI
ncbi:hypothetical protein DEO72_LG1g2348 [Vigna unguiculata]|uniref:Uncharacterized protein n=1 Tax=Vigna unguiculata TaxID=3917 RepID=A0A4D6KMG0_VIGUN|nr:hypothetical protein DEO72_LG1g2348 [Vigna unguiculata]